MKTMGVTRMRSLILAVGLAVLLAVAAVMFARGVDRVEVVASLLFIPVFVGLVHAGIRGGLVTAIVAALAYGSLRYPAIEAVGMSRFTGILGSRALAYLIFGGVGGWAVQTLQASLTKLDLYDQIDDLTGLHNARAFLQELDLEVARSSRYKTVFSLILVIIPASLLHQMSHRKRRAVVRDVAVLIKASVRTVDRSAYVHDAESHRFAVVLPETTKDGSELLAGRLGERVIGWLSENGIATAAQEVSHLSIAFPEESEALMAQRLTLCDVARFQFPAGTVPSSEPVVPGV